MIFEEKLKFKKNIRRVNEKKKEDKLNDESIFVEIGSPRSIGRLGRAIRRSVCESIGREWALLMISTPEDQKYYD